METPLHELSVERHIKATPEKIWHIMTGRLEEWWCPRPWRTEVIENDWRAGGRTAMVMRGPEGEEEPIEGVILEFTPHQRFVFTNAFTHGWRPAAPSMVMVGIFELIPTGAETLYRAISRHWDEATMREHEKMGFHDGWSAVAAQLAELAEA